MRRGMGTGGAWTHGAARVPRRAMFTCAVRGASLGICGLAVLQELFHFGGIEFLMEVG